MFYAIFVYSNRHRGNKEERYKRGGEYEQSEKCAYVSMHVHVFACA